MKRPRITTYLTKEAEEKLGKLFAKRVLKNSRANRSKLVNDAIIAFEDNECNHDNHEHEDADYIYESEDSTEENPYGLS